MFNREMSPEVFAPFELANRVLHDALVGRSLILVDRFASAGRNAYTGPVPLLAFRPSLALSYYEAWGNTLPQVVISSETKYSVRDKDAKHQFLSFLSEDIRPFLRTLQQPFSVNVWHETPEIREIFQPFGGEILAVRQEIYEKLEDKSIFNELLCEAGIPESLQIESMRVESVKHLPSYSHLSTLLGLPFVVQGQSSGGRGTLFVSTEEDLTKVVSLTGPLRLSRYTSGFSSNTTLLTVPDGHGGCSVYVDVPSHKAMHISEVGIGRAKGAGNDWSLPFPAHLSEKMITSAVQIGQFAFQKYGLVGLWGLDSIWNDQVVVFNELNCRNQGTTEVSGVNQILRGLPPFVVAHLAIHREKSVTWLPSADEYNAETLRRVTNPVAVDAAPFYLKVRSRFPFPVRTGNRFHGSGIYSLREDNQLVWTRAGTHTLEGNFDQMEVLVANAPSSTVRCYPGSELCTIEGITTQHSIFEGPQSLSPDGARLAQAIYQHFIPA